MTDPFSQPTETTRDERGIRWSKHRDPRPYIFDPEKGKEVLYSRVTSWIDCLDDRSTLEAWKQRVVLLGVAADRDVRQQIMDFSRGDLEDKEALNRIVEAAFTAGDGRLKAQKGTDLHALTEVVDGKPPLEWPEMSNDDLNDMLAYAKAMDAHGIEVLATEQRVVIDHLQVTGTFDRFVRHQGKRRIFDVKTGRMDYGQGKMAMQLAMYAHGELYDGWTQTRTPLEGVDREVGLICHLPAGEATCTIYEVDLVEGWSGVLLAQQVRQWRKTSKALLVASQPPLEQALAASIQEVKP